ncbi:MAG: hypothetical protein B7Z74_09630 [Deltaproteobacteria bacterium 21-66-5]|nr:MAG: hypothetical protein B7Z74_09630 [Deltaproteobacteria bacterium 21-66-5]
MAAKALHDEGIRLAQQAQSLKGHGGGQGREFVVIRPVLSERAMTARPALLPQPLLDELRDQILALPGISGVALDVTTKPPGTIEWE